MRPGLVLCGLALLTTATAHAKPATTLKIPETVTYTAPGESSWFLRGNLGTDLPIKGSAGLGIGAGYMGDLGFLDVSLLVVSGTYGAVRVDQSGGTTLGTEVGRTRNDADTMSMFSFGPGVGFISRFFGSERWVEIGRFGLNYAQFQDTTRGISFRGALANFQASFGYTLGSFMIAPGISWNLGYVANVTNASSSVAPSTTFLPLQWFSWQLGFHLWL